MIKSLLFVSTLLLFLVSFHPKSSQFEGAVLQPVRLSKILTSSNLKPSETPIIFNVGPVERNIKGAIYIGPTSVSLGIDTLRSKVQGINKNASIVIYCGCCAFEHCPNIKPAYDELKKLNFANTYVLGLKIDLYTDWEKLGYPVEKKFKKYKAIPSIYRKGRFEF